MNPLLQSVEKELDNLKLLSKLLNKRQDDIRDQLNGIKDNLGDQGLTKSEINNDKKVNVLVDKIRVISLVKHDIEEEITAVSNQVDIIKKSI